MKQVLTKAVTVLCAVLLFLGISGCEPKATPTPAATATMTAAATPTAAPTAAPSPTATISPSPAPTPSPTKAYKYGSAGAAPLQVQKTLKIEKSYKAADSFKVCELYIETPLFSGRGIGIFNINKKINEGVESTEEYTDALADEAKGIYEDTGEGFNPYFLNETTGISFNKNGILSLTTLTEQYTGGVHPSHTKSSKTYVTSSAKLLGLSDLFSVPALQYRTIINNEIIDQIEALEDQNGEGFVWPGYEQQIPNENLQNSFYLSNAGIVIVFQEYALGPYSSGILEFTIPYASFNGMLTFPAQ